MLKPLAVVAAVTLLAPLTAHAQPDPTIMIRPLPPLPLPPLPQSQFPEQGGWNSGGDHGDGGDRGGWGSGGDHHHVHEAPAPLLAAGLPAFAMLGGAGALARLKRRHRKGATKSA